VDHDFEHAGHDLCPDVLGHHHPVRQPAVFGICVALSNHNRVPQLHSEQESATDRCADDRFMQLKGHD
jgi:hypothetical protein